MELLQAQQAYRRDQGLLQSTLQNNQMKYLRCKGQDKGVFYNRIAKRQQDIAKQQQMLSYLGTREIGRNSRQSVFKNNRTSRYGQGLNALIAERQLEDRHSMATMLASGKTSANHFLDAKVTSFLLGQTSQISKENWQPQDSVNDLKSAMNMSKTQNMAKFTSMHKNNTAFTPEALDYGAAYNTHYYNEKQTYQTTQFAVAPKDFKLTDELDKNRKMYSKLADAVIESATTPSESVVIASTMKNSDIKKYRNPVKVYIPYREYDNKRNRGCKYVHETDDRGEKLDDKVKGYEWNGKYYNKFGEAFASYQRAYNYNTSFSNVTFKNQAASDFKDDYSKAHPTKTKSTTTTTKTKSK